MKRNIIRKLSSRGGESIGETLIALLISALALMMLAGAVTSGMRLVTNSKKTIDDYYKVNNAVAARDFNVIPEDGPTVKETTAGDSTGGLSVDISALVPSPTITVNYWKNEQLGTPVIAYKYDGSGNPTPEPTIKP